MMKWLGLLLVVCSGGGIGFLYAMQLRQERTNLERLCQMLREIAVQIAFRSLTVQELLEQLCRETAYAAFQFPVTVLSGMEQGLPLAEAWAAGIRQDKAVPEPAKKLLLPLGVRTGSQRLGRTGGNAGTVSHAAGALCGGSRRKVCAAAAAVLQSGAAGRTAGGVLLCERESGNGDDLIFQDCRYRHYCGSAESGAETGGTGGTGDDDNTCRIGWWC